MRFAAGVVVALALVGGAIPAADAGRRPPAQDSLPPKPPGSVTAHASGVTITVKWTAAHDNAAVAGYVIQRCQGKGCANFVRLAKTGGAARTYVDACLAVTTPYSYRVRGVDAAGHLGPFSAIATATTGSVPLPPAGEQVSPRAVALTPGQIQQFVTSLCPAVWSVDGIAGGSAAVGTVSTAGLYAPPGQVGSYAVMVSAGAQSATATVYVTNHPGVYTHHYDNLRTGQNASETVLTPTNVVPAAFGKLFSYALDGNAYTAPLYVPNLSIASGVHNVIYVATEHDSVYALDADGRQAAPLWHVTFINPAAGITTVPATDIKCCDISPELGITGTPVIDPVGGTLYVVAKTKEVSGGNTRYVQRLHALDLATGAEKLGGPVEIAPSVPGLGDGSQGGQLAFDPLSANQRGALLLEKGVVYVAFGSHGDEPPYHGWVLGYDAQTLAPGLVFNATPNGGGGGVWHGGGGIAADAAGNLYFATGNGTFDVNTGGTSYGDSFIKMNPAGDVLDYFTPHDQATLDSQNLDLGSGGLALLPSGGGVPPLLVEADKHGTLYLVNQNDMGHYNPNNDNQVAQSLVNTFSANFSSPVYWNGNVYFSGVDATLKAFAFQDGLISGPTSASAENYVSVGGALTISANGDQNGILWAIQPNGPNSPGVLLAYDATNLQTTLYSSAASGSRDSLDAAAKFSPPLVVNGKVFVGSLGRLTGFGLLP